MNDYGASDNGTPSFDTEVAVAEHDGTWVAVWEAALVPGTGAVPDDDIGFARSLDGGASWSSAGALNSQAASDSLEDQAPDVAGAGETWVAVWSRRQDVDQDDEIWFARSTNDGASWSPMQLLNTTATTDPLANDDYPHVAGDGSGTWVAVWLSNNDLGGTIGVDDDVLYARSTDDGVTWSAPLALNSYAAGDVSRDWPRDIHYDGSGVWAVVWDSTDDVGGIGTDEDVLISRSTDGGQTWSAAAPVNEDAATDSEEDRHARLTTDAKGTWMSVWQDGEPSGHPQIVASSSTDGGVTWSPAVALTQVTATAPKFPVVAESRGTWVITFSGLNIDSTTDEDIFQSQSTDGGQTWTTPANLQVDGDNATDTAPVITADDLGRFVLAWQGFDTPGPGGSEPDIFYRRTGGVHVPALPFAAAATTALLVLAAAWRRLRPR